MAKTVDGTMDSIALNRLMHLLPDDMTPTDIDKIIAINRKWFYNQKAGERMTTDLPKINLVEIGLAKPLQIKRRTGL